MDKPPFEMPEELRGAASKAVTEARSAVDRMMEAARQAVDSAHDQASAVQSEASQTSAQVMSFAHQHVRAALDFAEKLARASSLAEVTRLQMDYARTHADTMGKQAVEIGETSLRLFQKTLPGQDRGT